MTRTLVVFALVILGKAAIGATDADPPIDPAPDSDKYHLVWSDEFDDDGPPNPDNWGYERGFVRNEELQWYQRENARCDDGLLLIAGRRERKENLRHEPDSRDWRRRREFIEFTSAAVTTRGKHEWLYGRFEMRGRIDVRPGLWPAWWTLGSERGWPGCGEIDIMEYYSGKLLANAAWQGPRGRVAWDDIKLPVENFGGDRWAKEFHTWRMDWDRDFVRLYMDNEQLNEVDLKTTINSGRRQTNPFHEPHYMILNLAIGGTQGGDPSKTEFPAHFEVDYVRVYQEKQENSEAAPDE